MSTIRKQIQNLAETLKTYKKGRIAVISHVRPDADCIGSQVALCLWLQQSGIQVEAYNDDDLSPNITWLKNHFPIRKTSLNKLQACDAIVFVDGNHPSRFGLAGEFAEKSSKPLFMIDHHPDPAKIFKIAVSQVDASSTAELVYEFFAIEPDKLTLPVAQALYAGIVTDTGSFRFDSVSASTHEAVASMIRQTGLEPEPIHRQVYGGKTLNQLHLMARVLNSVELHHGGRLAALTVPATDFRETKTSYHDLEGIVNYGLSVKGVMAAVIFTEMDNKIKISLRSNSDVDVNIWARKFNGGGHAKAAGGWHEGPMDKAVKEVLSVGSRQLKRL